MLRKRLANSPEGRSGEARFSVVSNPEFLREGAAIADFMRPERIVLGVDSAEAEAIMRQLYEPFQRNHDRLITMSARSFELTKYAANAMLATRISFMNDLANLSDQIDADIEDVRKGIGSDSRIGYSYLYAGTGYGGSCFPKDVQALLKTGAEHGHPLKILQAVRNVNDSQRSVLIRKIMLRYDGNISGMRFAVWGLTFKPDTDDMREAPARVIIEALLAAGAAVQVFDPVAMNQIGSLFGTPPTLTASDSAMHALRNADALIIATEWKAFRAPDFDQMRANMKSAVIFDGRNLFEPAKMAERGFEYFGIGRRGQPAQKVMAQGVLGQNVMADQASGQSERDELSATVQTQARAANNAITSSSPGQLNPEVLPTQ